MDPDSYAKRKKHLEERSREFGKEFKKVLNEELEEPEHSDVMIEKQSKPDDKDSKDPEKWPRA